MKPNKLEPYTDRMNPFRIIALSMMVISFFMYMTSVFTKCGEVCSIISLVCIAISLILVCCVSYLESVHIRMIEAVYLARMASSRPPPKAIQITQPDETPVIGIQV